MHYFFHANCVAVPDQLCARLRQDWEWAMNCTCGVETIRNVQAGVSLLPSFPPSLPPLPLPLSRSISLFVSLARSLSHSVVRVFVPVCLHSRMLVIERLCMRMLARVCVCVREYGHMYVYTCTFACAYACVCVRVHVRIAEVI